MKRMHCDTFQKPGTVTLNRACSVCRPPLPAIDASARGAPNFDSLVGFVMPLGLHLVHD